MGGRKESGYTENFVHYIEVAEKMQRYKKEVAGMSREASEDVCKKLFNCSEDDLKYEEHQSRKELVKTVEDTFSDRPIKDVWADHCLFRDAEFLELNMMMFFCMPSDLAVLRCRSYKKNLKKNIRMTPRELERMFHKECRLMAEQNEKKGGKNLPAKKVASLRVAEAY